MIWMITKTDNAPILAQHQLESTPTNTRPKMKEKCHKCPREEFWQEKNKIANIRWDAKKKKRLTEAELQEIKN